MVVSVGFWKNPVQLTPKASVASAAKAPIRWSLLFLDDISVRTPRQLMRPFPPLV